MVKKVILAEDDSDDRDLFIEFYAHRNDIVLLTSVKDGADLKNFLEEIKEERDLPDLIVLDQNMPRMNGKQTLAFLKSHPVFSKIPAVIYSTYTDSNLIMDCKNLGAAMVASKPIDFQGYNKMMDDFLAVV